MNPFYIYIHYRKDNNTPFYVGKGKGRRATTIHGRTKYWNHINNKAGHRVLILQDNLTEQEAFNLEIQVIEELRMYGYTLVNLTDGGDGTSGGSQSTEAREKNRQSQLGRKQSDAVKSALSERNRLRGCPDVIKEAVRKGVNNYAKSVAMQKGYWGSVSRSSKSPNYRVFVCRVYLGIVLTYEDGINYLKEYYPA